MTAGFVRTEAEIEGRFEDVWVLIDEEGDLETWPGDADLAVVGKPATRVDGVARVRGSARYTVDVRLPGMLHSAVLRSPVAHGRVGKLDIDAARSQPGVRAALGPKSELSLTTDEPLLTAEPQYAGQPIAVVVADTPDQAQDALLALALEIAPLQHV